MLIGFEGPGFDSRVGPFCVGVLHASSHSELVSVIDVSDVPCPMSAPPAILHTWDGFDSGLGFVNVARSKVKVSTRNLLRFLYIFINVQMPIKST